MQPSNRPVWLTKQSMGAGPVAHGSWRRSRPLQSKGLRPNPTSAPKGPRGTVPITGLRFFRLYVGSRAGPPYAQLGYCKPTPQPEPATATLRGALRQQPPSSKQPPPPTDQVDHMRQQQRTTMFQSVTF